MSTLHPTPPCPGPAARVPPASAGAVLLPQPLGPTRATISPGATSSDTSSTATMLPKRIVTPCTARPWPAHLGGHHPSASRGRSRSITSARTPRSARQERTEGHGLPVERPALVGRGGGTWRGGRWARRAERGNDVAPNSPREMAKAKAAPPGVGQHRTVDRQPDPGCGTQHRSRLALARGSIARSAGNARSAQRTGWPPGPGRWGRWRATCAGRGAASRGR